MKRRRSSGRIAHSSIFDPKQPESNWSRWEALEGSPEWLYDRVRAGIATPEERAFLVDLHRRKIKTGRLKKGQITGFENQAIAEMVVVMEAINPSELSKNIIHHVARVFGVSKRHVYDAMAEFGKTVPQTDVDDLPARQRHLEHVAATYFVSRRGFPYIVAFDSHGAVVQIFGCGSIDARPDPLD